MTYTRTGLVGRLIRSTCDDCNAVASQSAHQYGRAVLASWEARHTCPTDAGAVGQGKPAAAPAEHGCTTLNLECLRCEPVGHGYVDLGGLDGDYPFCEKCHVHWPCPTAAWLAGQRHMTTVAPDPKDVAGHADDDLIGMVLDGVTVEFPREPHDGHLLLEAVRTALRVVEDHYFDVERDRAQALDVAAARAVNLQSEQLQREPVIPAQRIAVTQDTPQDAA